MQFGDGLCFPVPVPVRPSIVINQRYISSSKWNFVITWPNSLEENASNNEDAQCHLCLCPLLHCHSPSHCRDDPFVDIVSICAALASPTTYPILVVNNASPFSLFKICFSLVLFNEITKCMKM